MCEECTANYCLLFKPTRNSVHVTAANMCNSLLHFKCVAFSLQKKVWNWNYCMAVQYVVQGVIMCVGAIR